MGCILCHSASLLHPCPVRAEKRDVIIQLFPKMRLPLCHNARPEPPKGRKKRIAPQSAAGDDPFFYVFHPILSEQEEPGIILFLAKNL